MAGIYFHIPFCKKACYYCDFHFSTNLDVRQELLSCMQREVLLQKDYLQGETIQTIYFGGGTPSLLSADEIGALLRSITSRFEVNPMAEVTLEANPDDLSEKTLAGLRSIGINRLSIGIQSFQDPILQSFNRAHTADDAVASFRLARAVGFNNISLDIMYGIPGEQQELFYDDILKIIDMQPEHISAYCLTIEPQTVFGKRAAKNQFNAADELTSSHELEIMLHELKQAGYERYEVSNFSKPNFESKHNSAYWDQKKYLGIGPSAHSYNGETRQFNIRNNHLYTRSLKDDKLPFQIEILTREDKINEYLMTKLRTKWGADLSKLKQEFNYDLIAEQDRLIKNLAERGFAFIEGNFLKLSSSGLLLADKISSDLFLV